MTADAPAPPAIEVRDLVKGFGKAKVLRGVSLTVEPGTTFALLGANGSGKTTTINILTTLLGADGGTARIAGFDVASRPAEVRQRISVTGQFAAVDHMLSARENLVLMGELRHVADPGRTATELLARFDLTDASRRRPPALSGGMRRRLDIAMSLVGDAPVIFFDEPTTGLDPVSRNQMWATLRQLVEGGTTVFLTTQYLEEADRLADRVAILHGGRIVAEGTPAELKATVPSGVVELDFDDDGLLAQAREVLTGGGHEVEHDGTSLLVATSGSVAEVARLLTLLERRGIEPAGFSRRLPTLDDVFFKILDHDHHDDLEAPRASAR